MRIPMYQEKLNLGSINGELLLDEHLRKAFVDPYERAAVQLLLAAGLNEQTYSCEPVAVCWQDFRAVLWPWQRRRSWWVRWNLLLLIVTLGFVNRFELPVWREFAFPILRIDRLMNSVYFVLARKGLVRHYVSEVDGKQIDMLAPTEDLIDLLCAP